MAISELPVFSMLRTKMHWHQERQRLLAENIANADTPNFRPRDLTPLDIQNARPVSIGVSLVRTDSGHLTGMGGGNSKFGNHRGGYEVNPAGNAVGLEEEMMKVAANQMDYQAAATLYSRSLGLLKTALGRR